MIPDCGHSNYRIIRCYSGCIMDSGFDSKLHCLQQAFKSYNQTKVSQNFLVGSAEFLAYEAWAKIWMWYIMSELVFGCLSS